MWMKPLSLFTCAVFLVLTGINMYMKQSARYDSVGLSNEKSHFEMEPEKARAMLDDLDQFVKKKPLAKSKRNKRRPAQKNERFKTKVASGEIAEKYQVLEEAFLAREDNLLEVRFLQDEIRREKEEKSIELSIVDTW